MKYPNADWVVDRKLAIAAGFEIFQGLESPWIDEEKEGKISVTPVSNPTHVKPAQAWAVGPRAAVLSLLAREAAKQISADRIADAAPTTREEVVAAWGRATWRQDRKEVERFEGMLASMP
jgi:hypothetical protein